MHIPHDSIPHHRMYRWSRKLPIGRWHRFSDRGTHWVKATCCHRCSYLSVRNFQRKTWQNWHPAEKKVIEPKQGDTVPEDTPGQSPVRVQLRKVALTRQRTATTVPCPTGAPCMFWAHLTRGDHFSPFTSRRSCRSGSNSVGRGFFHQSFGQLLPGRFPLCAAKVVIMRCVRTGSATACMSSSRTMYCPCSWSRFSAEDQVLMLCAACAPGHQRLEPFRCRTFLRMVCRTRRTAY